MIPPSPDALGSTKGKCAVVSAHGGSAMANEVVVPFPRLRSVHGTDRAPPSGAWIPRHAERSRIWARLSTARGVVRGVVETLSYLREARVRPPAPAALPPARSAK